MYKDGILTISEWYKGMVKHPVFGFGRLQNGEVFDQKGIIVAKRGLQTSSKTAVQFPIARVIDIYGNEYWAVRSSDPTTGVLYKNNSSITGSLSNISDIKIYKNYLWVRYEIPGSPVLGALGAYGPLNSGSAAWFPAISSSLQSGVWGQLCVGQDDYLYITNGNYIARIHVDTSGTVGVAPTIAGANTSLTALDLPDGHISTCITEYGTKLAIGTYTPNGGGRIYTWNRQAGTLGNPGLADLPIIFNENGIYQLYSHANILYVTAGKDGNVYVSDGTNYRKLATLPFTGLSGSVFVDFYPNAITISPKGTLLIGSVSGNTISEGGAIWEITPNGEVCIAYTLAQGLTSNSRIGVGFISVNSSDNHISVGWLNGSSYGIDEDTLNTANVTIYSPLVRVGRYNNKKTFNHIEFNLAEEFGSGESITMSFRRNKDEAWTSIGTWGYSTLGAVSSFEDTAGANDCEYLQLKIETVGDVELIDVTLR